MKSKYLKLSLLAFIFVVAFGGRAMSQQIPVHENPNYGKDSTTRVEVARLLMRFNDAFSIYKNYEEAVGCMNQILKLAPKASNAMYINGIISYKSLIPKLKGEEKKNAVDSLMTVYDMRIENFGDREKQGKGRIMERKAIDYSLFGAADRENVYKFFREAIDAQGNATSAQFLGDYFYELSEDYKMDMVSTEDLLTEYDKVMNLLENSEAENAGEYIRGIEKAFVSSGAATCENIEKIFKPKYDADPNNQDLMKKILSLLYKNECKSEFQFQLAERYYALEPSPTAAASLGVAYEEKGDYSKAVSYFKEAASLESNTNSKANYLLRAATVMLTSKDMRSAAEYAKQSINTNPSNGAAYIILAQAYASAAPSCAERVLDSRGVYWLVVDQLNLAKKYFADDQAQVDKVNTLIGSYSNNFPNQEECFFNNLENGDSYTVNCGWVSGRTTVRERSK